MSTTRILALMGFCLLLTGCIPISGFNSIAALVFAVVAAVGAVWGVSRDKDETRVCQKAQLLDEVVTAHEEKYHRPPTKDSITILNPANKSNGASPPDTKSSMSQRV